MASSLPMKDQDVSKTAQELFQEQTKAQRLSKPLPASSSQIRTSSQAPCCLSDSKKKRIAQQVSGEWTEEATHTEQITVPIDRRIIADLAPKRVQRLHLKGPRAALKEMVRLEAGSRQKMGKVSKGLEVSQGESVKSSQDQLWRDLLKTQEERVFQIDRAIK